MFTSLTLKRPRRLISAPSKFSYILRVTTQVFRIIFGLIY